jgi:hypothetical protein
LSIGARAAATRTPYKQKVFWFFFSKKNCLPLPTRESRANGGGKMHELCQAQRPSFSSPDAQCQQNKSLD